MPPEPNRKLLIKELNNKISVDQNTGQVFMQGAVLRLRVPVIVVRHGETDGNVRHVLQGQADGPENQLNAAGKEQAKVTAIRLFSELETRVGSTNLKQLSEKGRLRVFTSPISRARDTANFFIHYFHEQTGVVLTPTLDKNLKELSFGKYDGYTLEEIEDEAFRRLVIRYRASQDATINWQGMGESFIDVMLRAKRFIEKCNKKFTGHLAVAFTHGACISALRAVLGEKALVRNDGMIAFRDHILGHAVPHWLSGSEEVVNQNSF